MIYIEEAIKKFNNLPVEAQVEFSKPSVINAVKNIEAKYKITLSSLIIYIAIDELKTLEEMSNFLVRECDIDKEKAKEAIKEIDQNVLRPIINKLLFLGSDPNKPMSILKEKEIAVGIFKEKIVEELNNIFIVIEEINSRLFYILAHDLDFKKELENALYVNNEKLTHKGFILDNKSHSPTIANWLKNFIKKKGSGIFDKLVLTEYLINSNNAKKLDNKERELLKKVLLLYRNIKFFPESMPSDDGEGWEIIPVDKISETMQKARTVGTPKTDIPVSGSAGISQQRISARESTNDRQNPLLRDSDKAKKRDSGKATSVDAPKTDLEKQIEELKQMALQYPVGSLERKAIEEEIKSINN